MTKHRNHLNSTRLVAMVFKSRLHLSDLLTDLLSQREAQQVSIMEYSIRVQLISDGRYYTSCCWRPTVCLMARHRSHKKLISSV